MIFDTEADLFDERAGLGLATGKDIARAVAEMTALAHHDLAVDIGAGTGDIGQHLVAYTTRYVGVDISGPMLQMFQGKGNTLLVQADCERPWPVADRAASVVFASRAIHLLDATHVVREVQRVSCARGYFLLGRVGRDPQSFPSRLRQHKGKLLAERGLRAGSGEESQRHILQRLCGLGAQRLEPRTVSRWSRAKTPRQMLDAWSAKPQLTSRAGRELDAGDRGRILAALTAWVRQQGVDLDCPQPYEEWYVLEGVRLA